MKKGFTLADTTCVAMPNRQFNFAFTLAEVLITLGIIGVVAALTMPTLIQNHRRKVVEIRLKETYSILNQAVKLSQVQNGESAYWELPEDTWNTKQTEKFLKMYIIPFIASEAPKANENKYYNTIKLNNGIYTYWALAGSYFEIYTRFNHNYKFTTGIGGKDYFVFAFYPSIGRVEPFQYTAPNPECTSHGNCCTSSIKGYAHALCAELIRRNGWKIPDDYPFRF